jgi:hypothetical protein
LSNKNFIDLNFPCECFFNPPYNQRYLILKKSEKSDFKCVFEGVLEDIKNIRVLEANGSHAMKVSLCQQAMNIELPL